MPFAAAELNKRILIYLWSWYWQVGLNDFKMQLFTDRFNMQLFDNVLNPRWRLQLEIGFICAGGVATAQMEQFAKTVIERFYTQQPG